MKFRIFILFLVVLICTLANSASVFAYYIYISNTSGEDSQITDLYNTNWCAQTFATPDNSVVVSSIDLMLYREGDPGTGTISIRDVDGSGKPIGDDLTSSTYNMSSITDNSSGEMVSISFATPYKLNANDEYAIVIRAASGSNGNEINWKTDASSPIYANGSVITSSNGGGTWTIDLTKDAIFYIVGLPVNIDISEIKVFENIFEENDRLFVVFYNISYPVSPSENPSDLFDVILFGYSERDILQFNNGVNSIYIDAENAPVWKSAQTIWLEGKVEYFNSSMRDTYTTTGGEYISSTSTNQGRQQLYDYVLGLASQLEILSGNTYTFDSVDYGNVLNAAGCVLFEQAIPDLGTLFPIVQTILDQVSSGLTPYDFTYTNPNESATALDATLMGKLGTMTDNAFTGLGGYLGVSGGFLKFLFAFFLYAIVASIVFLVSGNSIAAIILAIPALLFGVYIGMIPTAIIFTMVFLGFLALMYFLWVRGQ